MKPVADGGEAYLIRHTDSEYLLLENRQWHGWDYGLPGQGLVVYHVNYDADAWQANEVNSMTKRYRFELIPADNLDYKAWDSRMTNKGSAGTIDIYRNAPRLHRLCTTCSPTRPHPQLSCTTKTALHLTCCQSPSPTSA